MKNEKKVFQVLLDLVRSDPLGCLTWSDQRLELKALDEIPKRSRAGIASIERSTTGVKVKFHDKLKACELLLRYGNPAGDRPQNNLLEAILEATKTEVDISDIPELEGLHENGIFIAEGS